MSFTPRQERDWVPGRRLGSIAVISAVIGAIAVVIAWRILVVTSAGRSERANEPPPPPIGTVDRSLILTTSRGLDLFAKQRHELDAWGWADRDAGIARIPIDRAMDLVVQRAEADQGKQERRR